MHVDLPGGPFQQIIYAIYPNTWVTHMPFLVYSYMQYNFTGGFARVVLLNDSCN